MNRNRKTSDSRKGPRLSAGARRKLQANYRAWYEANKDKPNLGRPMPDSLEVGDMSDWESTWGTAHVYHRVQERTGR